MKIYLSSSAIVCMAASASSVRAFSSRFIRPIAAGLSARGGASRNMVATADSSTTNGFLQIEGLPKFTSIEPEDLTPAVEGLLETLDKDLEKLESLLAKTTAEDGVDYDQVLPEVEKMQHPLSYVWGVAGHLNGVKNGDALREAYESNQPKVVQAMTKFSQSKPLYDALVKIEKTWESSPADTDEFVDQQKRRAVDQSLKAMKLGGVGLEGKEKERFNEIKMRLAALSTSFSNNVLDETKAFALNVDDPEKMSGVPASAKALWAQAYVANLKKDQAEGESADIPEPDAEKGPWRITLDMVSHVHMLRL